MNQRSSLYLSLILVGCGMGLVSACSDDDNPPECTDGDCGGGTSIAGGKATGGTKATGGASATVGGTSGSKPASTVGGNTGLGGSSSGTTGGSATGGSSVGPSGGTPATGGTNANTTGGTAAAGAPSGGAPSGGTSSAAAGAPNPAAGAGGSPASGGTSSVAGSVGVAGEANVAGAAGATSLPPLGPNLALNATWWGDGVSTVSTGTYPRIFASSSQKPAANTPTNAFDGQTGTFWVSATAPSTIAPEFIGVEFAASTTITAVVVKGRMNGNFAYNPSYYTIQTSDDGTTWTTRATAEPPNTWPLTAAPATDPITTYLASPVSAKWVRMHITQSYYLNNGNPTPPTNTQFAELEIH